MNTARQLTEILKGTWHGRYGMVSCPCHPDKNPSVQINDDQTKSYGLAVHDHGGCRWQDIKDAWFRHGLLDGSKKPIETPRRVSIGELQRTEFALSLWAESIPLPNTRGWRYFAEHRGLDLSRLGDLNHALRWHSKISAVVALMTDAKTNQPTGIHRTILKPDNSKLERRMLGKAGVIRLSPDEDVTQGLGITEGIENGLAVLLSPWAPVWAAGSAWGVSGFPVLGGVESLTIFADEDETGLRAAQECAERWRGAGREVFISLPEGS
jgi:putative DNA primase/helicase